MSVEAALRRHVETERHAEIDWWPGHRERDAFQSALSRHEYVDDSEWKIVRFPTNRVRVVPLPAVSRECNDLVELRRLADDWKSDTLFMSSTQAQILHPSYQQIIGFGEKALPFLIDELRSSDDYWFWALSMVARENPVPADAVGNFPAMKQAWLNWAANKNI